MTFFLKNTLSNERFLFLLIYCMDEHLIANTFKSKERKDYLMEQNGWFRLDPNYETRSQQEFFSPHPKILDKLPKKESSASLETAEETETEKCENNSEKDMPPILPLSPAAEAPAAKVPREDASNAMHSQTVGERGPVTVQDGILHETLETFAHAKSVERAVHVKGFGASGFFQPYACMREYTQLCFLQDPSKKTPVASRFSLAVSTKGTPDTSRNVRGFSTKFYTEQGVFDLLCNHIPVFLVRDAIRFPAAIKSLLPSPQNNLPDSNRFWEFFACTPEATHFVTWLYSDLGTVKSLRHIRAYGVNTYVWKNANNVRRYVKYHWLPLAGEQCINRLEAARLAGENPDIAGRDLFDTIAAGTPVEFELNVQLMDEDVADSLSFDPLDDTKIWDEKAYPLIPVGRLTLDRNPDNYNEQVEKLAFSPANLLDGAELSDDKMLQGRSFVYWDAQRYRLGPEFRSIPVNKQADWMPDQEVTSGNGRFVEGKLMRSSLLKEDYFTQAGEHYRSLSQEQQDHLARNIASELVLAALNVQKTVLDYFCEADETLADSIQKNMKTCEGRE